MVRWLLLIMLGGCAHTKQSYEIFDDYHCSACVEKDGLNFVDNDMCTPEQWAKAKQKERCFTDRRK